jgi:hypothetical protein
MGTWVAREEKSAKRCRCADREEAKIEFDLIHPFDCDTVAAADCRNRRSVAHGRVGARGTRRAESPLEAQRRKKDCPVKNPAAIALLSLIGLISLNGCYARTGYYAEPVYYAPPPPPVVYVHPHPMGYYPGPAPVVVATPTPVHVRPYGYANGHGQFRAGAVRRAPAAPRVGRR